MEDGSRSLGFHWDISSDDVVGFVAGNARIAEMTAENGCG